MLDISRDIPQTLSARQGTVTATVTYTERNFLYEKVRVRITRAGRTALDSPIQLLGCPDGANDRPSAVRSAISTAAGRRWSSISTRAAHTAACSR